VLSSIWKALLALWSFVADTAQILGVDWKQILALIIGTGGGTLVIGIITGVGAFQLAVGVTAVMFFVAGASAFSRYRNVPPPHISTPTSPPIPPIPANLSGIQKRSAERSAERIMVPDNITPNYLGGFYDQHTEAQANKLAEIYIGKWIRVSGLMRDVWEDGDGVLMLISVSDSNNTYVVMRFGMGWKDRLFVLTKKTSITALGQIARIQLSRLFLHQCELLEIPF